MQCVHQHMHRVSWCPAAKEHLEGAGALHIKSAHRSPYAVPQLCMQLVLAVMEQLEGAYALLIKSTHYPGELVACKRGSPLILGLRAAPKAAVASPGGPHKCCWLCCFAATRCCSSLAAGPLGCLGPVHRGHNASSTS